MTQEIKALLPKKKAKAADVLNLAQAVDSKLFENGNYKTPVLSKQQFEADLNLLITTNVAALDGGKTAIAARNKALEVMAKDLRILANYATANCNDDVETFLGSGFQVAPARVRTPPQPVGPPAVTIDQTQTTVMSGSVSKVPQGQSYEMRLSSPPAPGSAPVWITVGIANSRVPATFSGLTPGVVYTFQARTLGRLGYSDWSDPVTRMCI